MQASPVIMRGANRNLFFNADALPQQARHSTAAIGIFDGMHLGHRQVLQRTTELAAKNATPSMAITFEPPPKEYFGARGMRLLGWRQRMQELLSCGLDYVLCLRFNRALSLCPERDFATQMLQQKLMVRQLVVGDNFRYGHLGEGDAASLRRHGLQVQVLEDLSVDGHMVSSTAIRKALSDGDLRLAQAMLGRPHSIHGRISRGQRLARRLGFPTANLIIGKRQLAPGGVFVVRASTAGQRFWGVANIGTRPSVAPQDQAAGPRLEAHLLDCQQDLYGQRMEVELYLRLRDERRFSSLERLRAAIADDVERARRLVEQLR